PGPPASGPRGPATPGGRSGYRGVRDRRTARRCALRGWPTPLGVVLGDGRIGFHADGCCTDPHVQDRLTAVGEQVMEFARMRAAVSLAGEPQGTVR
ncbi:hypothetical protein AB0N19_40250, partial [Streptomyces sp. NPDC051132]